MQFSRFRPSSKLSPYVEWYWMSQSESTLPQPTKIIPDGLPEVVFHFGDPFRIRLNSHWHKQSNALLGGQLRQFCYLQNTGRSEIFGITFSPTGLTRLFGLQMSKYAGKVVSLRRVPGPWAEMISAMAGTLSSRSRIAVAENLLKDFVPGPWADHSAEKCVNIMRRDHGMDTIAQVCEEACVTERQIQRLFSRFVGLSPKYYARILRFNHLFHLIQGGEISWADVVHLSGYYDQSHFIRDFKRFTGEDPTAYPFREKSLTNFFTQKSGQARLSGLSNQLLKRFPSLP